MEFMITEEINFYKFIYWLKKEASPQKVFLEKSVFKNFAKSTKNTCFGVSVFEACNSIKRETPTQAFSFDHFFDGCFWEDLSTKSI